MKLAVLTHGFPAGENPLAANFLEPFLGEIHRRGNKIWVVTPAAGFHLPQPYPVKTFDWGSTKLLGQLKLWKPSEFFSLTRFLKLEKTTLSNLHAEIEFDHVLAVWMIPNALAARSLKKKYGVPYSTWSLGTDINRFVRNPLSKALLKMLIDDASNLFANSHKLCAEISGLSGKTVTYLPTYRPLEKPGKEHIPQLMPGFFHFLCVARLEPVKGVDVLIEAFRRVVGRLKNARLHILGDGTMRQDLVRKVKLSGIAEGVRFYGMVKPVEVAGFLKKVDCLVMPSRTEGMPVAFWEAQSAGVPVIGTDAGDLGWAIGEYGQGIVVEPEDVDGLAEAMKRVIEDGKRIMNPTTAKPPDPKKAADKFLEVVGA